MPKAKKLPSGSYRTQVYDYTDDYGKRHYESFTAGTAKEAEYMAAEFKLNKGKRTVTSRKEQYENMTLEEAIEEYIESRKLLKRSPTTIQGYYSMKATAFPDLMKLKLKDIDADVAQRAIHAESKRPSQKYGKNQKPISAKRLKNEWGLVSSVLHKYCNNFDFSEIELPTVQNRIVELPTANEIFRIIKGTDIELPVLLAMWLSFSMSEVRGLTKSKSIKGNYITVNEVVVDIGGKPVRKEEGKTPTRNRKHKIPTYIKNLIDQVDGDELVQISGYALYHRWTQLLKRNGLQPITFHDLRHLNASVMALLRIPDKYAQERGGWKSDSVMKKIYMQTFPPEREQVDSVIDSYFEEAMQHEMQHEIKKSAN